MTQQNRTLFDQHVSVQNSDVLNHISENTDTERYFGTNLRYLEYSSSTINSDKNQMLNQIGSSQTYLNNGPTNKYRITPNEQLSPQYQSRVNSNFNGEIFSLKTKNNAVRDELHAKENYIQTLQNKLENMSQSYSNENLRQLEQMNRLIAVILDEKNESITRLETRLSEQYNTLHFLSKKLDDKDLMINKLQREQQILHKRLNMKNINSPVKDSPSCVSNSSMDSNDLKYIQSNNTKNLSDYEERNIGQDKLNTVLNQEEQCHHPSARRTSPVEPWRKVYVKDEMLNGGRIWYWCPKHKMPDYNGLYVTHHPNEHYKWADKVAGNKKTKTINKESLQRCRRQIRRTLS